MKRLIALTGLFAVVASGAASARVGFGDPAEPFRERAPDDWIVVDGHLRLRGAVFGNLDLDRGPSPSTGKPLWPAGEGPLDTTTGADMRVRLAPSFFLGDDVRVFLEVDLLDNVALGVRPRGTPYAGAPGIVAGGAFQEPLDFATGAFRVRSAVGEVLTPFGTLSAGRAPSHFGLGIAANAGDDVDDDGGDRADRVAFVTPLFGHFVAASFDWAASGAAGGDPLSSPDPRRFSDEVHSLAVALLRFRSPWEVELYREAGRVVFDYGAAFSTQWQRTDVPGFYQSFDPALASDAARVPRNYLGLVVDVWARAVFGPLRIEAEAIASHLDIENASPLAGVELREPVTGNPFGGVVQVEWQAVPELLALHVEGGVASADPAYGFVDDSASPLAVSRPGDVKGPQIDGSRDTRVDAFRFHPAYRVDLILWRSLLGGVSEAGYARAAVRSRPLQMIELELSTIYSQGLLSERTPGGVGPLGLEVDGAATLRIGQFSVRTDAGVLFPFGGLGARGGSAPGLAHMILVRLGYEA
jgi:uncharacterized protein (TIGR04551 family)